MEKGLSKYHRLPLFDGLEALKATNYNVPFPFHFHPTFNISLVYDGVFSTKLNTRIVNAEAGKILITNPNEIHANPLQPRDGVSFFTFYLPPDFLTHTNQVKSLVFNDNVIDDNELFKKLHELALSVDTGNFDAGFEHEFTKAFAALAKDHGSAGQLQADGFNSSFFEDLLAEENSEKFSLQDSANRLGIDKYKFLRLFKYQTGLTPNNYFILRRIEKSKEMLAEGRSLLSVAIDLGFYDVAHFCHQFKRFTGISPTAYCSAE